ncbi:MAG: hypothetical protein ACJAZI_001294 [Cycloclasticus sp.]|jgi:hypothetical protein
MLLSLPRGRSFLLYAQKKRTKEKGTQSQQSVIFRVRAKLATLKQRTLNSEKQLIVNAIKGREKPLTGRGFFRFNFPFTSPKNRWFLQGFPLWLSEPALWRVPQRLEKASILRAPLGEVVGWHFSGYSFVAIDKRVTRPTG